MSEVTEVNYPKFKAEYEKAKVEGKDTFEFEGQTILTDYARYLIQAIQMRDKQEG